ncbi:tRNA (adenine(58)-N(1))-methyltransferase catalytic subunit TRMT61A-like [Haliotis rufescens]|uniref:tRNA (adenine(58)-N(1))-methyltransferase catalytic subunit TRMT61A-like n=1 Tax=Haliotis rufescens TaxID=6454 RepID=UPI00201E75D6|nr:tRNA (adenine(58)-N(1))-methyltransferase catalytic subunit TRMT61A-like [Haliotis rufescens]
MSFAKYKKLIEEGDTVILYLSFNNLIPITVKSGQTHQNKYGALKHSEMIGVAYGSKINLKKGYVYVLHPTPELWTQTVPHRTQILYTTDISMILTQLDLRPGSVVVESGTGSGSLSHSLIKAVMPTGHLHTFEFHKERAGQAAEEFKAHGLSDYVTAIHRDVCGGGFQLDHVADAVFLDLPSPWECIASAKQALKKEGGRLCNFSPCIEQVQKACEALSEHGFKDLTTLECLLRNFNVRSVKLPLADLGQSELETPDSAECVSNKVKVSKMDHSMDKESGVKEVAQPFKKVTKCDLIGKMTEKDFVFQTGAPPVNTQGHTGFLTFATLYPS